MRSMYLGVAIVLLTATAAVAALPTILYDGRAYVDLERIAQTLGTKLESGTDTIRARLRTPRNVVTFTRNWSQIVVDGRPVLLDGPVRVKAGVWLVPESFVTTVLPRIATTPPAALPRAAATVTLDEWRLRSYPSFT